MSAYYPASLRGDLIFWSHQRPQRFPSGVWTPMALNNLITTRGTLTKWTSYVPATTAIAVASNGAILPVTPINVDSTAAFATAGFLVIEIAGVDRLVQYTGKNATQFTGCTLGVGTLATGNPVRQANVHITMPPNARVGPLTGEQAFAVNATNDRGIRLRTIDGVFNFPGGTKTERACATQVHHVQTNEQPGGQATTPSRLEAFHDAGVDLDSVVEALSAPRIVVLDTSAFSLTG